MKEITTCRVINSEDKKQMTVITEWLDDEMKIILLRSGLSPLIGETTLTEICQLRTGKTREEAASEVRRELSGDDEEVGFSLRETKLTWKKKIWKKGTVEMRPVEEVVALGDMNVEWLGEFSSLRKTVVDLQTENETLRKNFDELTNALKEMERMKKSMEDTLYKQFLLLLNSKKRKIRELEEKLSNGLAPKEPSVYEENTDVSEDEEEKLFSPRKRQRAQEPEDKEISPVASTSRRSLRTPLKCTPDSDDEMVLRYDESQLHSLGKRNTDEDSESDLFSQ